MSSFVIALSKNAETVCNLRSCCCCFLWLLMLLMTS